MRKSHFAAIATIALAGTACADVIMSNLSFADDVGGTLFGPGSTTIYKAYGWTMPSDAYELDGVTLRLAAFNTDEARVSIWSGASTPETELIELDAPTGNGPGYDNYTFTPSSLFTLDADTTYWVYIEALGTGGDGFLWGDTSPATMPSGIGTSVGYVFNGSSSSFFNTVEVTGHLVPAPGAAALLILGAAVTRRRHD